MLLFFSNSSERAPTPKSTVPVLMEAEWLTTRCETPTPTTTTETPLINENQADEDINATLYVNNEIIDTTTDTSDNSDDDDDFIEVTSTTLQFNNSNTNESSRTNENTPTNVNNLTNDNSQPSTSHYQFDTNNSNMQQQQQQIDSIQYEECQVREHNTSLFHQLNSNYFVSSAFHTSVHSARQKRSVPNWNSVNVYKQQYQMIVTYGCLAHSSRIEICLIHNIMCICILSRRSRGVLVGCVCVCACACIYACRSDTTSTHLCGNVVRL